MSSDEDVANVTENEFEEETINEKPPKTPKNKKQIKKVEEERFKQ